MSGREHVFPWDISDAEYFDRVETWDPSPLEDQINDLQAEMLEPDLTPETRTTLARRAEVLRAARGLARIP